MKFCRGLFFAFGLLNSLGVMSILFFSFMFLPSPDLNIEDLSVVPPPASVTNRSHRRSATNNATTIQREDGSRHARIITPIHKADHGESIKTTKVTTNNADNTTATSPSENQRLLKDRKETLKQLFKLGLDHATILGDIGSLPPWSSIVEQYGTQPVILGLETCAQYRHQVPLEHRWVAAAGLFHTGTNLIADLLMGTCHFSSQTSIFKWQVPVSHHFDANFLFLESTSLNESHSFRFFAVGQTQWRQSTRFVHYFQT
jgi:hypothetical protein